MTAYRPAYKNPRRTWWAQLAVLSSIGVVAAGYSISSTNDKPDHWLLIEQDSSYHILIDTTRITRVYGRTYRVWYRTEHAVPRMYNGKEFDREVVQSILKCDEYSFKVVSVDMSLGRRRLVAQQRTTSGELGRQPWHRIEAGTTDALAAKATCEVAGVYATHPT